jgi:hypothetical protein
MFDSSLLPLDLYKEKGTNNDLLKVQIEQHDPTMIKRKGTKEQRMVYKALHRKIKIEQHKLH